MFSQISARATFFTALFFCAFGPLPRMLGIIAETPNFVKIVAVLDALCLYGLWLSGAFLCIAEIDSLKNEGKNGAENS